MLKHLMNSTAVRAPEDGTGGGSGGTTEKKDGQPVLTPEQFKEFTDGLTSLRTDLGTFGGDLKELVKIAKERNQAPVQTDDEPDDGEGEGDGELPNYDATTLETLPRAQFMDYMLKHFKANLEGALKPINERINNVGVSAQTQAWIQEGEKVKAKNPDFPEWKDEMLALAKDHPNMGIQRLYTLAKAENPEKVAELAKKYKKEDDTSTEGKPKPKAGNGKPKPFSMSPGSGGTSDTKNQKMNAQDAAADAWEQTVAKFGSPFGSP